jgi:hypothetical protein
MFNQIPEKQMHRVRWILTSGWLLLIFSLFYDPFSPILTHPNNTWSPFSLDLERCVKVQGFCIEEQPYPMGNEIFWGIVVPSAIFILLVFGHELWRRICPLSFLSQIPRALGLQRQFKRVNAQTGKVRFELAKIKKDSWLGRNYLYLQLGWFYVGLCSRILFINSNRIALAIWLLFTIGAAMTVGYFYGGKSWCNYFCPMSPVQKIYGEPRGLFASKAHEGEQLITQSMCRIVDQNGKEQSACVACQSPCIDIDSERSYWDSINEPKSRLLYYGYIGVVIGYFLYYYLYAGDWSYYFSGAWAHQENQLQTLLNPGFYIFNTAINIPKIIAVPLTLGVFMYVTYWLGVKLEKRIHSYFKRQKVSLTKEEIQNRIYSVCTFLVFNFFFIFGGRSFINTLPLKLQFIWESIIVVASTVWLYRNWNRSPKLYSRESFATRFRKQLRKLELNIAQFLEGTSLDDLDVNEVYVLAKVLPSFTKEKRHQAYKGVVKEALEEGYVDSASSLEVLRQMRLELDISDQEHRQVLEELGVEDPELFNPQYQHTKENLVRLTGYRKALERVLSLQQKTSIQDLVDNNPKALKKLRQEYSITTQEENLILQGLDADAAITHRGEFLLQELGILSDRYHALNQPLLLKNSDLLTLLRDTVQQKKRLMVRAILEILEQLHDQEQAVNLAQSLSDLETTVLQDVLANPSSEWYQRLTPEIISKLQQPKVIGASCSLELTTDEIIGHLQALLIEPNPLIQALCLYIISCLDVETSKQQAQQLIYDPLVKPLVKETGEILLKLDANNHPNLANFSTLEKIVYLGNSNFFDKMKSETLIDLADLAEIRTYQIGELITEEGDTCRELLLLIEGIAEIELKVGENEVTTSSLLPGQVLDELEVLSHGEQAGTITAKATPTRIIAIPVAGFDHILDRDHDLAKMVLEMETRHLQQLIKKAKSVTLTKF